MTSLAEKTRAAAAEFRTVRDMLRLAVSEFSKADLVFGHGTDNALDEAVFLTLAALRLPIDNIEPWLDARLTEAERQALADLITRRVETRIPAPYLVGEAWIGPFRFAIDKRVIVPRSFIGELLLNRLDDVAGGMEPSRILDLCTGSGCLAIILAHAFPEAEVVAADLSQDALSVAEANVAAYGLQDRISLVQSDLFESLEDVSFDLIISNPPYVRAGAVAAFPPEYASEPKMAHLGGGDGLDLVHRILVDAGRHLTPGGWLVVEVGQERKALEAAYPEMPFLWLDTEASEGEVFRLDADQLPTPGH